MNKGFIPQMEPWFGEEEKGAISEYMEEGGWLTEFKRTEQFENMIAEYTGARQCIVVNNGTISLTLAAMGRRGRQAVREKFNWTREEPKLLQLYAQLLDGALSGPGEGRTA